MKKQVRLERQAGTLVTLAYFVIATFVVGAAIGFAMGYLYGVQHG